MAFQFDKLTTKAQESLQRAQSLAMNKGHQQLVPLHLLKGLDRRKRRSGPSADGTDRGQSRSVEYDRRKRTGSDSPRLGRRRTNRPFAPAGMKVLEAAQAEAEKMSDEYVSTEHLLLALTNVEDSAQRILKMNGVAS